MKMIKSNIKFNSGRIQEKDILSVYEYGDYIIAKFQYYTSNLSYNFGQIKYGGFKETWGLFNKDTKQLYASKDKRSQCKDIVDKLNTLNKTIEELDEKEHFIIVQRGL